MATVDRPELMEEVRLSKNPRERENYDNLVSVMLLNEFLLSDYANKIGGGRGTFSANVLKQSLFHFRLNCLPSCLLFNA